ncbi:MAG TPA: hypothetical protein VHB99_18795 [Pirellulales bacterium]|nr:hypothetical protein [Pirellulales bacterium]
MNVEKPAKVLLNRWRRASKTPELAAALADREGIEAAIRRSEFCRRAWFVLSKLFGATNREGQFFVEKLLAGDYADRPHERTNRDTRPRESAKFDPQRISDF